MSSDIEPDFTDHKGRKSKTRIIEFTDESDVFDTSSGSFSHLLPCKSYIPEKF